MIYFDNAATTRPNEESLKAFSDTNSAFFANPHSQHSLGYKAQRVLESSRKNILRLLGLGDEYSLIFTSGATEANNLALKGTALYYKSRGNTIISSNAEHPSVSNALKQLAEEYGFNVKFLPIGENGTVDPALLKQHLSKDVILVSLIAVNNEIGSVSPIAEYSSLIRQYAPKALFHIDATQAIGKMKLPLEETDMVSFSSHKFGGLKGNGGLIFKKKICFVANNAGGDQEFGYRGGTVDVAGAKSTEAALQESLKRMPQRNAEVKKLHDELISFLKQRDDVELNSKDDWDPYLVSFYLKRKKAAVVVEALSNEGIYVSTASACNTKKEPVSETLLALKGNEEVAANSIRVSFYEGNTLDEVKAFEAALDKILREIKDR